MKKFCEFLKENRYASVVTDKFGKWGGRDVIAWIQPQNSGVKERSIFALEPEDYKIWDRHALKQVYRIYHMDDKARYPNESGLVKIDAKLGVVWFLDHDKMGGSDERLIWKQKYKIKEMSVFDKKFYENQ